MVDVAIYRIEHKFAYVQPWRSIITRFLWKKTQQIPEDSSDVLTVMQF